VGISRGSWQSALIALAIQLLRLGMAIKDFATGSDMSIHESSTPPAEAPFARLEQSLIDEYVRLHGHDPAKLTDLVAAEREALLKAASLYASCKLSEVETRSHYLHELHDAIGDVRKP